MIGPVISVNGYLAIRRPREAKGGVWAWTPALKSAAAALEIKVQNDRAEEDRWENKRDDVEVGFSRQRVHGFLHVNPTGRFHNVRGGQRFGVR